METNKDFLLRNIKKLSDFLISLTKQEKPSSEEVEIYINAFTLKNFNISFESLLEKQSYEIAKLIEINDIEDIKDFADILFVKYTIEMNLEMKKQLSKKTEELYRIYQNKTATYSFEVQLNIDKLNSEKFLFF